MIFQFSKFCMFFQKTNNSSESHIHDIQSGKHWSSYFSREKENSDKIFQNGIRGVVAARRENVAEKNHLGPVLVNDDNLKIDVLVKMLPFCFSCDHIRENSFYSYIFSRSADLFLLFLVPQNYSGLDAKS